MINIRRPRMAQLFAAMYVSGGSNLFGLTHLQDRHHHPQPLFYNSAWLNARGELLGYGGLSIEDVWRITQEIDPSERFLVASLYPDMDYSKLSWRVSSTRFLLARESKQVVVSRFNPLLQYHSHQTYFEQLEYRALRELLLQLETVPV